MKPFQFQSWVKILSKCWPLTLLLLICHTQVSGKIQDWERSCVVGECVSAKSAYSSCSAQPLDIRLGHPTKTNIRSEPVFKNRPNTLSAETCHLQGRGSNGFIPICCPERKNEEAMLIAGLGAGAHEFPHQVRLLIKSPAGVREKCAGTIYSRDYILTAASCLVFNGQTVSPSAVEVISGQTLEHLRTPENIHTVRSIKIHEGYTGAVHTYGKDNDIALLRLNQPLDLSRRGSATLKALRIPEKGYRAAGRRAIILGWGRTAVEERPIGALLKMNTYINTNAECNQKSQFALKNGKDLHKTRLRAETPHDEFGHPDTFDLSTLSRSSKTRNRNSGSSSFGRHHSLFEDDDFFNWGKHRGSILTEWDQDHQSVNLGALRLGRLWEGGVEYKNKRGSQLAPMPPQLPSSLLCLGGGEDSIGYSRGDTGAPAICDSPDGTPILCGISSYGRNEFRGEWPATYVNVAHYADWIHTNGGRQSEDTLIKEIIDGMPISSPDEASFFIRIRNKKTNATCGGALINSRTVISSVACVPLDVRTEDLAVTSGELSIDQRGTELEIEGIATRETYKSYRSRSENRRAGSGQSGESSEAAPSPGSLRGDFPQLNLAVLKLYQPVRSAKPIELIKPRMERTIVYEYGWRTDGRDKALNKWAYKEVPLEECKARYNAVGIQVDEAHLCASETYSGGDRCNNELGNPLICVDRLGKKYLCGVTGIRDCSFAFPTVFTNVVQNLDWIQL